MSVCGFGFGFGWVSVCVFGWVCVCANWVLVWELEVGVGVGVECGCCVRFVWVVGAVVWMRVRVDEANIVCGCAPPPSRVWCGTIRTRMVPAGSSCITLSEPSRPCTAIWASRSLEINNRNQ